MRIALLITVLLVGACAEPIGFFPGGALSGEVQAPPVEWAEVPDTIQVEINPDEPYSINIWAAGIGDDLYIATSADGTNWSRKIETNPNVRVRIGESIYELTARALEDPVERADVLDAYVRKYEEDPEGSFVVDGLIFRLDRR